MTNQGYLVHWDVQRDLWKHTFDRLGVYDQLSSINLAMSESYFNFDAIRSQLDEIVFELYEFSSFIRATPAAFSAFAYHKPTCLVVDCGHSFTHIVPVLNGCILYEFVLRVDVGGKLLTNYLKELVSYRELNVMDETYVVNECKEDVCFVTDDVVASLHRAKDISLDADARFLCDYVLPDFHERFRGECRSRQERAKVSNSAEQILRLGNERFMVPEVLFRPTDLGINQMGLSEAIHYTIEQLPTRLQGHFYTNVLLTGGSVLLKGLKERVAADLRAMAPDVFDICVTLSNDPIAYACKGGAQFLEKYGTLYSISREQYQENGVDWVTERLNLGLSLRTSILMDTDLDRQ